MSKRIWVLAPLSLALTGGLSSSQQQRMDELHRMLPAEARDTEHALGDVDGDGDLDLLSYHRDHGAVGLAHNDGRGAFAQPVPLVISPGTALGPTVEAALLADVDGDGDLDAFVGRSAWEADIMFGLTPIGAQNLLFRRDGSGSYTDVTAGQLPALADQTFSAAAADMDGDGDLDLVVGNEEILFSPLPFDVLLRNDGSGLFSASSGSLPASFGRTDVVGVSDLDGDGDLDMLLHESANRVLMNDGTGTFVDETFRLPAQPGSRPFTLADLDGDSDVDLLSSNRLLVNDGLGFFAQMAGGLPAGAPNQLPVLADVNEDDQLDAFLTDSLAHLYLGVGSGDFLEVPLPTGIGPPAGVQVGDVDGDGDQDAVLGSRSQADLLLGDGTGQFLASASILAGALDLPAATCGALHDLNGDEHLDLFLASTLSSALLLGNGTGEFVDATANVSVAPGKFAAVGVADAEGDGDPDLFLGGETGTNRLLSNDGAGTFAEVAGAFPEPSACRSLVLADLDADGFVDVVFGQTFTIPSRFYRNDGLGGFAEVPSSLPFSGIVDDSLAADLDLDGALDLAVIASNATRLLWNDGSAAFTGSNPSTGPAESVAAADGEGDGDIDLALGTSKGASNEYLRNNGTRTFTRVLLPGAKREARGVAFVELDGNGRPDLVFANYDDAGNSGAELLLNGIGGFSDVSSQLGSKPADNSWQVLIGDVDADGDQDALIVNGRGILPYPMPLGITRVYSNLYRHLAWRSAPAIGKPLVLDQHGTPGALFWLLAALAPGELELPPLGTLRVDPATFEIFASGALDASGRNSLSLPIPKLPGLIGLSLYFQSALGQPILLSNLETVTFTGF